MKEKAMHISGAEAVIRCLLAEGVDLIYGYPGGAIMPVYDELYKFQDDLHHVLTRHEQGATHAAQGYARTSGKVGVAIATSGPGATNLITGIADAQIDSTPMVCITGQVGSHLLGSDAFQETDIIGISTPVTKWNYQVTEAKEIPEILARAFYIARSGRPGPVLVDITKDAQFGMLDFEYKPCTGIRSYKPVPTLDQSQVEAAAEAINKAKQPLIVWGQGVILGNAEAEFKAFVEKSGIPAVWTILGLSALETSHPLNKGMVGMHGNYAPNLLTQECDVLIAIGMRFDDRVTGRLDAYAAQAEVVHLEIDPAEIDKNVHADWWRDQPQFNNHHDDDTKPNGIITQIKNNWIKNRDSQQDHGQGIQKAAHDQIHQKDDQHHSCGRHIQPRDKISKGICKARKNNKVI